MDLKLYLYQNPFGDAMYLFNESCFIINSNALSSTEFNFLLYVIDSFINSVDFLDIGLRATALEQE